MCPTTGMMNTVYANSLFTLTIFAELINDHTLCALPSMNEWPVYTILHAVDYKKTNTSDH